MRMHHMEEVRCALGYHWHWHSRACLVQLPVNPRRACGQYPVTFSMKEVHMDEERLLSDAGWQPLKGAFSNTRHCPETCGRTTELYGINVALEGFSWRGFQTYSISCLLDV
jgi:hypothetical protein